MKFQQAMNCAGVAGLGLAATLMIPANVFGQELNYGPPASSYVTEAMKYPDAATKPTPHMQDGHPDLNGVWHHFFGELVHPVGNGSFARSEATLGESGCRATGTPMSRKPRETGSLSGFAGGPGNWFSGGCPGPMVWTN